MRWRRKIDKWDRKTEELGRTIQTPEKRVLSISAWEELKRLRVNYV